MIALSLADQARWAAVGGRQTYFRVDIADAGAVMRDMTTYPGENMCMAVQWSDSFDNNGVAGQVTLKREVEHLSLAPLMQGSPLNRAWTYPGTYAALIDLKRKIQIYTAIMGTDQVPAAADWVLRAEGLIDTVDWGQPESIVINFSDHQGELRDAFIEQERIYNYADPANAQSTKGTLVWVPLNTIVLNDLGCPTDANRSGFFYKATVVTGTTGATEPVWPQTIGATVVDNNVTWTCEGLTTVVTGTPLETGLQQILNDNGLSAYTLNTPTSPAWLVKFYLQQRQSVWDAMRALVDQLGWDLRFKYDSGSGTFKLTLWTPNRAKTTPDFSFVVSDVFDTTKVVLDISDVRNVVKAIYSASGSLDATGTPLRQQIVSTNSASVAKYGRRYMELDEASTSNIDTSTEAQAMADACVADLCNPTAEQDIPVPFFPWAEIGDLYQFAADGIHYDASQKLALYAWQHNIDLNGATTTLTVRGALPTSGKDRWLAMQADVSGDGTHMQSSNNVGTPLVLSTSPSVGGVRLALATTMSKRALGNAYEYHLGTAANFTPSAASLIAAGENTHADAPHLIPGKQYFFKAVVRGRNEGKLVRSGATPAVGFFAGQASAGHLSDGIALGDYPLNGGFETRVDPSGMPDHWTIVAGTLGTEVQVKEDTNGVSGNRYLRLNSSNGDSPIVLSAQIPILNEHETNRNAGLYRVSFWYKNGSSNVAVASFTPFFYVYDFAGTNVNLIPGAQVDATTNVGHWQRISMLVQVDAGATALTARSIAIELELDSNHAATVDFDEVRVQYLGTPWYEIGSGKITDAYETVPSFANGWVNYDAVNEETAALRRNQFGEILTKGIVKSGTIGSVPIFTAPPSMRPLKPQRMPATSNTAFGHLEVRPNGEIWPVVGSNAWFSLANMSWWPF